MKSHHLLASLILTNLIFCSPLLATDKTEWHAIVLWRNLAEWAERYVRKGMKIYVEGKLQTRTWEKEGQVRRKTEVVAENVQILFRPAEYQNMGQQTEQPVTEMPQVENSTEENIF